MQRGKPTLFASFFLLAISVLACAIVVSILIWMRGSLDSLFTWAANAAALAAFAWIVIMMDWRYSVGITYNKNAVRLTLILYWISFLILFVILIKILAHSAYQDILYERPPPWAMISMSIILLLLYALSERFLFWISSHWASLSFINLILLCRFNILGSLIIWLEKGWHSIAVKFSDVLLGVWLVQSLSRIIWQTSGLKNILNFTYSEIIRIPNSTSNASLFDIVYSESQKNFTSISYSGPDFAPDMISSIFSLLWYHWQQILAIWFLLEVISFFYYGSKRIVIMDAIQSPAEPDKKTDKDAKNAESKELPSGSPKLAELLAMKLDRINQVYRSVDEKRAIQTAGIGEPINAAIKVERLEDVTLSSSSQISLGYLKIPVSSISALLSNILPSPKIVISLHQREYEAVSEEKSRLFLVAKTTGTTEDHSWLVDCPESVENNPSGKDRTVEDMVTEMAHRIFATLQADATGQSINWKAMWKYNEGSKGLQRLSAFDKKAQILLKHRRKEIYWSYRGAREIQPSLL